jgi:hypothetical protein
MHDVQVQSSKTFLPSRDEILGINDISALEALHVIIDDTITAIETRLEFSSQGMDWEKRAISALAINRNTKKWVERRLNELRRAPPTVSANPVQVTPHESSPEVQELFERVPSIDVSAYETTEEIQETLDWLVPRVTALRSEKDEENNKSVKDFAWLRQANGALSAIGVLRNSLLQRSAAIRRAEQAVRIEERDRLSERAFINAARARLPQDTYAAIWEDVFQSHPELRGTK